MFKGQDDFKQTLANISGVLNSNNISWCLGASGSLFVQGVAVEPHDIDVIVDINQFDEAHKLLAELSPGEREEGVFGDEKYYKAKLEAVSFPAEMAGFSLDPATIVDWQWEGLSVKVHPLAYEVEMYKKRAGKEHIVELIEQTLAKEQ